MKRFVGILLALMAWAAVFSVCAEMLRPDEVTTWEEARLFAPALDALWPEEPQPSYTQQTGFSGLFITPEEAWETLNAAYDQAGDAGTRQVLESWGILETAPEGSPVRHSPDSVKSWRTSRRGAVYPENSWRMRRRNWKQISSISF